MSDGIYWRPVLRHGYYEVSNDGRVRSTGRWVTYPNRRPRWFPSTERKPALVKGYPHLTLADRGRKTNAYIHTLVCEAFHGPRPSREHEVRHLNGDPLDNRAENLAWGTKKENAQDSIRHGTNKERNKTHCKRGHPFDEENTLQDKTGRFCRTCLRAHSKRWYEKNRVAVSARSRRRLEERAAMEGRQLRKRNRRALTELSADGGMSERQRRDIRRERRSA